MCEQSLIKKLDASGIRTKIVQASDGVSKAFAKLIGGGCRAVFLFSEEESRERAKRIFEGLRAYSPVCIALGEGAFTDVFSLPDDVRVAVGYGRRAIEAARFFATLRGCACIAIPSTPSVDGCFARSLSDFAGYPLEYPNWVLLNGDAMRRDFAASMARTAMSALCAEELRTDALFSGNRYSTDALEMAAKAVQSIRAEDEQSRISLFYASALFALQKEELPPFACMGFMNYLTAKMPQNASHAAYAVLRYAAERMTKFWEYANPRAYYVPDYAGRLRAAAEQIGCSAKELYENVRVPTAEESFARVEIFAQSRRRMAISARLFAEYVQDVARGYFAAEARATPLFPLELGYDLSAEMTPLLCVPVLEREFGLAHSFERAI